MLAMMISMKSAWGRRRKPVSSQDPILHKANQQGWAPKVISAVKPAPRASASGRGALFTPFHGFLEIALQCAIVAASDDFIQSLGACVGMVLQNALVDFKASIDSGSLDGEIVLSFIRIFDEEGCLREHKLGADFRSVRLLV